MLVKTAPKLFVFAALMALGCDGPEPEPDAEPTERRCVHARDGAVPAWECLACTDPEARHESDPRDPRGRPRWQTCADYEEEP